MRKLELTPVFNETGVPVPILMRTGAASRYVGVGIVKFRQLVRQGIIPARRHRGSKHPVFHKADLDDYAANLQVFLPDVREASS